MKTRILHEDRDILVIYKPAGLATQTARAGQQDVVSDLKNYLSGGRKGSGNAGGTVPYLGVIHRLDQPVEGLLVFAKNRFAAAALTGQLQGGDGTFCKRYSAVICGRPDAAEGELTDWLYKNKENKAVVVDEAAAQEIPVPAKPARLHYRLLQYLEMYDISLMDIRIDTGRFHQIRAQMAHAGMPLLGDRKYGGELSLEKSAELGVGNTALCACRLEFMHPVSKRKMCFRIEPEGRAFSFFATAR